MEYLDLRNCRLTGELGPLERPGLEVKRSGVNTVSTVQIVHSISLQE